MRSRRSIPLLNFPLRISTPEACIGKIIRNQLEIIFPRVTADTCMCVYVGKRSKVVGGGSFETIDNGCSTNGRSVSRRDAYFRDISSLVCSFVRSSARVNATRGAVYRVFRTIREISPCLVTKWNEWICCDEIVILLCWTFRGRLWCNNNLVQFLFWIKISWKR